MARIDELGELEDSVRLTLGGDAVKIYGRYEVASSVFEQPAAFSMKLGSTGTARELAKRYPPHTPFALQIAGRTIQTGRLDGCTLSTSGGGTDIALRGRDALAPLYDAFIASERSFSNTSYLELLKDVLKLIGLSDVQVKPDNIANRKAISGAKTITAKPLNQDQFNVITNEQYTLTSGGTGKTVINTLKAKLGERWHQFLESELKKAGLFLWAGADGALRIARPTADQAPLYRIIHRRGTNRDTSNVISAELRNDVAQRYTRAVVYGRGGGRKFGRTKIRAELVDPEISKLLGGVDRKEIVYHESECDSVKAAEFMARRRIAEANRNGWELVYTVSGHTVPGLQSGRLVWTPDTVVDVEDDELGVNGPYYIASVTFERGPETTTKLSLMRPQDLVFGTDIKKATGLQVLP
jgi:prophage tail gpP-like protein